MESCADCLDMYVTSYSEHTCAQQNTCSDACQAATLVKSLSQHHGVGAMNAPRNSMLKHLIEAAGSAVAAIGHEAASHRRRGSSQRCRPARADV